MKKYSCKQCFIDFDSARITRSPKFCSINCRNKSYKINKENICSYCKNVYSYKGKERKFCSQSCVNQWKKIAYCGRKIDYIKYNCAECGKEGEKMPCKIVSTKIFCNHVCKCKFFHKKMSESARQGLFVLELKNKTFINLRSRWEALFIKDYLEKFNLNWKYEPQTFKLSNGKTYTPDFYIEEFAKWIEIKGYDYENQISNRELFVKEIGNLLVLTEDILQKEYKLNTKYSYTKTLVTKLEDLNPSRQI